MGACAYFQLDPAAYFAKPRDERIGIVGYYIGRISLDAMRAHDTVPKKKGK